MGKDAAPEGQGERIQGENVASSLVTRLMLCVQQLGEDRCHLIQKKSLGDKGAGGAKWHLAWTKRKGRLGFKAEKENVLQPPLPLLL